MFVCMYTPKIYVFDIKRFSSIVGCSQANLTLHGAFQKLFHEFSVQWREYFREQFQAFSPTLHVIQHPSKVYTDLYLIHAFSALHTSIAIFVSQIVSETALRPFYSTCF